MSFRYPSLVIVATVVLCSCEFTRQDNGLIYQNLPGQTIQDMAINSAGDVWFITTEIDTTIKTMPVENPISDIEVDAANRIWVSTYNEGYFILDE